VQAEEKLPLRIVVVALSGFAPLSIDMYLPGLPELQRHFASSAPLVGAFGTTTALPMAVVIASFAFLALLPRFGVALSVRAPSELLQA